jgi:hypothetical protein
MNKLNIAIAVFIIFFSAKLIFCQSETTMQDIVETASSKVTQLEDEKNQEVVNLTIDLLVNQGRKTVTRALDPNFTYTVTVLGDRRISKITLTSYVQNGRNREFVNELSSTSPVMTIKPEGFDLYDFTVTVDSFKGTNVAGHFALIIYHDDPTKKK